MRIIIQLALFSIMGLLLSQTLPDDGGFGD